jgi:hypothetical protein
MIVRGAAALLAALLSPAFASTCASNANCSYNGACEAGACACTPPWTGAACDELALLPLDEASAQLGYQGAVGGETVSSWGGSVVGPDESGVYHMYAAEMGLFCGINTWLSNSIVIHATSPDPLTVPFVRRSVVQGAFAHEPIAARAPSGEFVVFFSAVLPPQPLPVKGGRPCEGCAGGVSVASCGTDANRNASVMLPTYMVFSADPDGPWSAPQMVPGTDVYADSNFAPLINADGSLLALTRGAVYRAADWRDVASYKNVGSWPDHGEDVGRRSRARLQARRHARAACAACLRACRACALMRARSSSPPPSPARFTSPSSGATRTASTTASSTSAARTRTACTTTASTAPRGSRRRASPTRRC